MIFLGNAGSGKTYFCAALMNALKEEKKHYFFIREKEFFDGLIYAMQNDGESADYEMQKVSEMPFLVIDDVGASKDSEFRQESIFDLIDRRWVSRLPTVITSNLFLKDFNSRYHPRLTSRLTDCRNTIIELKIEDRRRSER